MRAPSRAAAVATRSTNVGSVAGSASLSKCTSPERISTPGAMRRGGSLAFVGGSMRAHASSAIHEIRRAAVETCAINASASRDPIRAATAS